MVYVDEIEVDQEGIAEMMLDENAIAQVARKLHLYVLQNTLQEAAHDSLPRTLTFLFNG